MTASPEPFSNAALSLGRMGWRSFLPGLLREKTVFSGSHVAVLMLIMVLLARWALRSCERYSVGQKRSWP